MPTNEPTLPETQDDSGNASEPLCPVLTYVLGYDDLLRADARAFVLDGPRPVLIGRAGEGEEVGLASPTELRVPDRWLSGTHCLIDRRGGDDVLVDQGSRNGTRVHGKAISEWRLQDGDRIEAGHSLFVYRRVPRSRAALVRGSLDARQLGPTASLCPEVIALARDLRRIGSSREPVLVLAETGAGKEIVARAVHEFSARRGELRAVDCGAIPENLFESTFFGHRKGAFTGADADRAGELQRSDGGTLFLDEVGNLGEAAQAKLLRVVETGQVTPVGASRADRVDLRCVAATNRQLFGDASGFRQDLLHRLAGYVAQLPPLRHRREDLGLLTAHILREAGVGQASISAAAARLLYNSGFGGNIRQLRTALRSAALLAGDERIEIHHLPDTLREPEEVLESSVRREPAPRRPDRETVERALAAHGGNVTAAARELQTHARQIYRWVERYGIDLDSLRR